MSRMYDIVAIGESLMDCAPVDTQRQGMPRFEANPGGAPANVLAMNARLGGKTAFIGMVGEDAFGHVIEKTLQQAGIDTRGLCFSARYNTTLAFVQLDAKGDRSFSFYRHGCADVMLEEGQVRQELLQDCRVFHFGSVSLTEDPCRTATLHAAQTAAEAGAVISYDPNFRPLLWPDRDEAVHWMRRGARMADIIKVSDEEMTLLTGETDLARGCAALHAMGPAVVFVTMGEKGACFDVPAGSGYEPALSVKAVDTTGAGDAFLGAMLHCLKGKNRAEMAGVSLNEWHCAVRFANAAGGLTTMAKGAIPAMPDEGRILAAMK